MGSATEHSQLVNAIILKYSRGNIRLWRNETGVAINPRGTGLLSYGCRGSSDILGILGPDGTFLGIEVKTGKNRQSKQQKSFQAIVARLGGHYLVARSVEDVDNWLASLAF